MPTGKILLIDDDLAIRGFLQDFLEDRGFNVEIAGDGAEGVEKFKAGNFDLIVCDMLMPKMIGLDVLKHVKEIKPAQPIIIMSGVKEESMIEKAKALGCKLYLSKPVQLKELEVRIQECFPE